MRQAARVAAVGVLVFALMALSAVVGRLFLPDLGPLFGRPSGIGALIVVAKDVRTLGTGLQACVRYQAFDKIEETCVPIQSGTGGECYNAARVGQPLPQPCIGR